MSGTVATACTAMELQLLSTSDIVCTCSWIVSNAVSRCELDVLHSAVGVAVMDMSW